MRSEWAHWESRALKCAPEMEMFQRVCCGGGSGGGKGIPLLTADAQRAADKACLSKTDIAKLWAKFLNCARE